MVKSSEEKKVMTEDLGSGFKSSMISKLTKKIAKKEGGEKDVKGKKEEQFADVVAVPATSQSNKHMYKFRGRDEYKTTKSFLQETTLGFHSWKKHTFRTGKLNPKFPGMPIDLSPESNGS